MKVRPNEIFEKEDKELLNFILKYHGNPPWTVTHVWTEELSNQTYYDIDNNECTSSLPAEWIEEA